MIYGWFCCFLNFATKKFHYVYFLLWLIVDMVFFK